MIEKINPFPFYIYKTKASHQKEIKEYLMKHVYPKFNENGNGGLQKIFTDYLPGTGAMIHWPYIYDRYQEDVRSLLTEAGFDMSKPWDVKLKGWYNFTTKNNEEWIHDHMGGATNISYAFTHFVHLEDEDDGTIFLNPNYKMIRAAMPTKNINYLPDDFFNDRYQIKAEEGDIVMFPSWLDHTAPKHESGNLRIVNAVNVMLRLTNQDEDGF